MLKGFPHVSVSGVRSGLALAGVCLLGLGVLQSGGGLQNKSAATNNVPSHKQRLVETYGRLPLSFEANQGQAESQVKFLSRGPGYTLLLTPTEAVMAISQNPQATGNKPPAALRMKLVGANPNPKITALEELPGKSNYFNSGNMYVTATTASENFPTASPLQARFRGCECSFCADYIRQACFDAFVAKLNARGDLLVYSTTWYYWHH